MRWLLLIGALSLFGCHTSPADKAAFIALKHDFDKIAPEYLDCLEKHKTWTDPMQFTVRVKLVIAMQRLLEEKAKP